MKILITGFNGFLGTPLTLSLLIEGHQIIGISTRHMDNFWNDYSNLTSIQCNYTDFEEYQHLLQDLDLLIHLAYSTVPENSTLFPDRDILTNVIPSLELIQSLAKVNFKKIIFISSGGVIYGNPNIFPTPENENLNPISSYGISKMIIERNIELLSAQRGFDFCILRMSNIYGAGHSDKRNQGVINIWMEKIRKEMPIEIFGTNDIVRDYIHLDDVVNALLLVIARNTSGVYNIGTAIGTSLEELLTILGKETGKTPVLHKKESRKFDVEKNILSFQKFNEATGWQPSISLTQGIRKLALES